MRIALNIEKIGARFGGAEKYVGMLARTLTDAGHSVHVVARVIEPDELPATVTREIITADRLSRLGALRAWRFASASAETLSRQTFDLVVGFNKAWYQDAYIALAGAHPASLDHNRRRFRSPLARSLWSLGKAINPTQWTYHWIDAKQFGPQCRPFVIAPSRMVAEHFRHYHGVPEERLAIVPNGIETTTPPADAADRRERFRKQCGLAAQHVAVLFVARNYALKGLEPLLQAFAPVARKHDAARLVVCGSERDRTFRRQAERLGILDRVIFCGFVRDPRDCFAGGDVFAFPSFYDPGSLVVPEAQVAGLPVITTKQNGAGELLTEGVDGYVIDSPWAVEQLTDRIDRLVGDDDLRRRMGQAAQAGAARHDMRIRMRDMLLALERIGGQTRPAGRRAA